MGCIWSTEGRERCNTCPRRAVNNLVFVDGQCEVCIAVAARRRQLTSAATSSRGPRYGEYKCRGCGRFWSSRLSWPGYYQICKRCRRHVFPQSQRDLRPSDMTGRKENKPEHKKELCQMCQQMGHYCAANAVMGW